MIERNETYKSFTMTCDEPGCSYDQEFDTGGNFHEFIQEAKRAGWVMRKDKEDEWRHSCPSCSQTAKGES